MKVVVTGGAGYIGSVVTAELILEGHDVVVVDNLVRGHADAVPEGAKLVRADLLDLGALTAVLAQDVDAVMHFAALSLVGESMSDPAQYYAVNIGGTATLLGAMERAGVGRLVFSSSAATYGNPSRPGPIVEDAPTDPTNPYGATKLAVDQLLSFQVAARGLGAVSLRYFNVAGSSRGRGERHDPETHLIPLVLATAAGRRDTVTVHGTDYPTRDGTAVRDYIHVADLARAHLLALKATSASGHRIYNLGNGQGFSVREVIDAARQVTGEVIPSIEGPRRPGDPAVLVASSARIQHELGWVPQKPSLTEMIADAWTFMRSTVGP